MSLRKHSRRGSLRRLMQLCLVAGACLSAGSVVWAGHQLFNNRQVGGISIDADGVVSRYDEESRKMARLERIKALEKIDGDMSKVVDLRKVSLRGLEAAVKDAVENNLGVLPDEVKYLAGLQRIQYVFVYPELNDVVLAGPAEGWTVNDRAEVVGVSSGRPVLQLDDLLVALRSVQQARNPGITCSIDPTAEGRRNLDAFLATQKVFHPAVKEGVEKALGPQVITVTGVPQNSHFARVLVAADYHMKRIAMKLDPSPIKGLPSFVDMLPARGMAENMMPRWWLACNYQPLAKSADGLAWELRGQGVKALTEDEFIAADGSVTGTGKTSPVAKRWADLMTEKYDELAAREPVFCELRNLMDMCVVAALIEKESLLDRADCSLPTLTTANSGLMVETSWNTPKTIATQCSLTKKGRNWIITASGGVQVESWQTAAKTEASDEVLTTRKRSFAPAGSKWWWN